MEIIIRQALPHDDVKIYELLSLAFAQDHESLLVQKLKARNEFIPELSIIAELDGEVVGHILFTGVKIQSDTASYDSLSLAPVSVLPAHQNKGIGARLITGGLKRCKELGYKSVIVLGHPHYYPKFGFKPAYTWEIKSPFEVRSEAFMGLELEENELHGKGGTVMYPKEFFE